MKNGPPLQTSPSRTKPAGLPATLLGTWFGCGYSPFAPGTAGSAGALAAALLAAQIPGWKPWYFALLAAVFTGPGVWAAGRVAGELGVEDPGRVVVDEVLGQWLTLAGATVLNWKSVLGAFLLFRLLDIVKPPPARQSERLPGGLGIVMDDLLAGVYGALVLFAAGCFNFY